ncbi:unnamed protein product [Amoebophrya sp. A120]|nr:unnamed protein product [Amoebophrya sp. A120]|eukprot:GSA120T00004360001.1
MADPWGVFSSSSDEEDREDVDPASGYVSDHSFHAQIAPEQDGFQTTRSVVRAKGARTYGGSKSCDDSLNSSTSCGEDEPPSFRDADNSIAIASTSSSRTKNYSTKQGESFYTRTKVVGIDRQAQQAAVVLQYHATVLALREQFLPLQAVNEHDGGAATAILGSAEEDKALRDVLLLHEEIVKDAENGDGEDVEIIRSCKPDSDSTNAATITSAAGSTSMSVSSSTTPSPPTSNCRMLERLSSTLRPKIEGLSLVKTRVMEMTSGAAAVGGKTCDPHLGEVGDSVEPHAHAQLQARQDCLVFCLLILGGCYGCTSTDTSNDTLRQHANNISLAFAALDEGLNRGGLAMFGRRGQQLSTLIQSADWALLHRSKTTTRRITEENHSNCREDMKVVRSTSKESEICPCPNKRIHLLDHDLHTATNEGAHGSTNCAVGGDASLSRRRDEVREDGGLKQLSSFATSLRNQYLIDIPSSPEYDSFDTRPSLRELFRLHFSAERAAPGSYSHYSDTKNTNFHPEPQRLPGFARRWKCIADWPCFQEMNSMNFWLQHKHRVVPLEIYSCEAIMTSARHDSGTEMTEAYWTFEKFLSECFLQSQDDEQEDVDKCCDLSSSESKHLPEQQPDDRGSGPQREGISASDQGSTGSGRRAHQHHKQECDTGKNKDEQIVYLAQHNLFRQIPELKNSVPWTFEADVSSIWMGTRNTITNMHYDTMDNAYVQVAGYKRIKIAPPWWHFPKEGLKEAASRSSCNVDRVERERPRSASDDEAALAFIDKSGLEEEISKRQQYWQKHRNPVTNVCQEQLTAVRAQALMTSPSADILAQQQATRPTKAQGANKNFVPNLEVFGKDEAALCPIDLVAGPGDLVIIPKGWLHAMHALTPSISVNFWMERRDV